MPRVHHLAVLGAAVALLFAAACSDTGSEKAFCDAIRSGENPIDVFNRYDPADAAAEEQLQAGVDRLRVLEKAAPDELRSSVTVLVDDANAILLALDPQARDHPQPDIDLKKLEQASNNVVGYSKVKCSVTLASAAPVESTTTSTTTENDSSS